MSRQFFRSEQYWEKRKCIWGKQYEKVVEMNEKREELADLLQDCSPETKRLVAPILKYKITEVVLTQVLAEAKIHQRREAGPLAAIKLKTPDQEMLSTERIDFKTLVDRPDMRELLGTIRGRIDKEGAEAA